MTEYMREEIVVPLLNFLGLLSISSAIVGGLAILTTASDKRESYILVTAVALIVGVVALLASWRLQRKNQPPDE